MARNRAQDYQDKRKAILHTAARVFADCGFDRTPMSALARECGVSKALLYHYHPSKKALLFDILHCHLGKLVDVLETSDRTDVAARERLEILVGALLEAYRDADAEHKVQISSLHVLALEERNRLYALERRMVSLFADAIRALNPAAFHGEDLLKPVTMSLFGMMNWFYLWFREDGSLGRKDYARLATHILAEGVMTLRIQTCADRG